MVFLYWEFNNEIIINLFLIIYPTAFYDTFANNCLRKSLIRIIMLYNDLAYILGVYVV